MWVRTIVTTLGTLVFATTTPVPQGGVRPHREVADVAIYNERARRVMAEFAVGINDLYVTALPRLDEIQRPIDVHFRPAGNRLLAAEVARHLRAAIAKR